jgi:regulator of protease activity HflC (stomatin/prohibitin superfamily)
MADIANFGFFRRLRSDASYHIQHYERGRRVRSGRGLSFWFLPDGASLTEIPMDDRDLPFLFNGRSKDFQEITVQGVVVWRVANPEALGDRIDFSLDLAHGRPVGQPMDQIANLLTGVAQQFAAQHLAERDVGAVLEGGVEQIFQRIETGLTGSERLRAMGIEVVSVRIADVSPSSELKRALQTPTFERLQQQADQATFERRALAVEKERAIAENELQSQIELARRQKDLIEREDANARNRAESEVATRKIAADGEAETIRTVEQAKADMERARMEIYAKLPSSVMMGLAARDFAGKLKTIEHLNVTPDMLSSFLQEALGRPGRKELKEPKS